MVELLLHSTFIKDKEPELRPKLSLQNKILRILKNGDFSKSAIAEKIGHKVVSGELNKQVRNLVKAGLIMKDSGVRLHKFTKCKTKTENVKL